jgi:hypothetical protein
MDMGQVDLSLPASKSNAAQVIEAIESSNPLLTNAL